MLWQTLARTQHGDFELARRGRGGLALQRCGLHHQHGLSYGPRHADEDALVGLTSAGWGNYKRQNTLVRRACWIAFNVAAAVAHQQKADSS